MLDNANRRLSACLHDRRTALAVTVVLKTLGELLFCGALAMLGHITADLAFRANAHPSDEVITLVTIVALLVTHLFCMLGVHSVGQRTATITCQTLRRTLTDKLLRLGPQGISCQPAGHVATLFTDAVEALEPYFQHWIPNASAMACVPACLVAALLPFDWITALVLLACGPLMPLFMVLVGYRAQDVMEKQWGEMLRLSSALLDRLQGLGMLEVFGRVQAEVQRLLSMGQRHRLLSLRVMRIGFLTSAVLEFFSSLSIAVVAVFFAARLLGGHVSFERAFIVLLIVPRFFAPFRAFSASYHTRMNALSAFERIEAFLALPDNGVTLEETLRKEPVTRLDLCAFSVAFADELLFAPLSASFKRGTLSALTGPSGVGKTSFLRALLGFVPHNGTIIVNGDEITGLLFGLRGRIAWVPQKPQFIAGSIRDNLLLAFPEAKTEQIREAARMAEILDEIEALPRGLDTDIGDQGRILSGGQAQRIALARALLKSPDILLLDEPTASVDHTSAARILATLMAERHRRIVLVATHDEAIIAHADQRIAVTGSHDGRTAA